jgi:hypothetical protein
MDTLQAFSDALTELEAIQGKNTAIAQTGDPAWKREFIGLRREFQERLAGLAKAADQCVEFKQRPDVAAELRQRWSNLRSAVAHHQANWPAVDLDLKDRAYAESIRDIRTTFSAYVQFARQAIAEGHRQQRPAVKANS